MEGTNVPVEATTAPGKIMEVKPTTPQKLTPEQLVHMFAFIGKCTFKNVGLPGGNKFNIATRLTIQDICNASIPTLVGIAKQVKKAIADDDTEFSGGEPLKIAGLKADEWLDGLKLILQKRRFDEWARENRAKLKALEAKRENLATPEEQRKKIDEEILSLSSVSTEEED